MRPHPGAESWVLIDYVNKGPVRPQFCWRAFVPLGCAAVLIVSQPLEREVTRLTFVPAGGRFRPPGKPGCRTKLIDLNRCREFDLLWLLAE